MTSLNLLRIAVTSAALAYGTLACAAAASDAAPAKHTGTAQNHHCRLSDGTMDAGKTKKACLAEKGTWAKDNAGAASGAAPAATASAASKK